MSGIKTDHPPAALTTDTLKTVLTDPGQPLPEDKDDDTAYASTDPVHPNFRAVSIVPRPETPPPPLAPGKRRSRIPRIPGNRALPGDLRFLVDGAVIDQIGVPVRRSNENAGTIPPTRRKRPVEPDK